MKLREIEIGKLKESLSIHKYTVVFSNNYDFFEKVIRDFIDGIVFQDELIEIDSITNDRMKIVYNGGGFIRCVDSSNKNLIGHRYHRAIVDMDVEYDEYCSVLLPMLIHPNEDSVTFVKYEDLLE